MYRLQYLLEPWVYCSQTTVCKLAFLSIFRIQCSWLEKKGLRLDASAQEGQGKHVNQTGIFEAKYYRYIWISPVSRRRYS